MTFIAQTIPSCKFTKNCKQCGEEFETNYSWSKFCEKDCSNAWHKENIKKREKGKKKAPNKKEIACQEKINDEANRKLNREWLTRRL